MKTSSVRLTPGMTYLVAAAVFALVVIAISYRVMPWHGVLTYGDAVYLWPGSNFHPLSTWMMSFTGLPWVASMFGLQTNLLPVVLESIGLGPAWSGYVLSFGPLWLAAMVFWFIGKRISGSSWFGYASGLFIIFNNFSLEQFIIWPGHYYWNVAGLGLALYLGWRIAVDGLRPARLVGLALASLLIVHPFLYVLYISFVGLLSLYLTLAKRRLAYVLTGLGVLVVCVLLNSFWIVPFIGNLLVSDPSSTYNGNQLSVFEGYRQVATYANLFNLKHYPGFFSGNPQDSVHNILQTFVSYVLLGLLVLSFVRRKLSHFAWFSVAAMLVYFNAALGPASVVTGDIWTWAFSNVPGFGFFRSFTRFIQMFILLLIVSLAFAYRSYPGRIRQWTLAGVVALMIGSNAIFLTGDLNGLMTTARLPKAYTQVNSELFDDRESARYSILAYPHVPYEANTWNINRNADVFPQLTYFKHIFFHQPVASNLFATFLNQRNDMFENVFAFGSDVDFDGTFDRDIDNLNARYIIVQKDLVDITRSAKKVSASHFTNNFSESSRYRSVEANKYFDVYENPDYRPLIIAQDGNFQSLFDTAYRVRLTGLKTTTDLTLLQTFHPGWKVYLDRFSEADWCRPSRSFPRQETTECKHQDSFLEGTWITQPGSVELASASHRQVETYANGWRVDPEEIKAKAPAGSYRINSDGSMDVDLMIYFKPQSWFASGLLVSAVTLVLVFGAWGMFSVARLRRKA